MTTSANPPVVIAVDGTAGSGKSTLARGLAQRLRCPYVNTGLMYRAVTREALDRGLDLDDGAALGAVAASLAFSLSEAGPDGARSLEVEGSLPGPELVDQRVEDAVSRVASHAAVREALRTEQRRLGRSGGVIEGRDIGSVVFPKADVKLFLQAAPATRADRRIAQRGAADDEPAALGQALHTRDARDARVVPHKPTPDAVIIDTTHLTIAESLGLALRAIANARPDLRSMLGPSTGNPPPSDPPTPGAVGPGAGERP